MLAPTDRATFHTWLGRLVITAGVANGFLSVQVENLLWNQMTD
jgi:hypothetical protein